MKELSTEIAIIGAGASGLAAALRLAEFGIQAMLFDRTDDVGGEAHGGGGIFAVESHMQNERNYVYTKEQAFDYYMEHTNGNVDARLVSDFIDRSAFLVEWLEGMGVQFHNVAAYFKGAGLNWHTVDAKSPRITDAMYQRYQKLGGTVVTGCKANSLVLENGVVCGFQASGQDGTEYSVRAKYVVLATGGYIQNPDFVNQYTGYRLGRELPDLLPPMRGAKRADASGIQMAWKVGAEHGQMCLATNFGLPDPYAGPGGVEICLGDFRQPNLLVNLNGERITNEEQFQNPGVITNLVRRQKEYCAVMILDEAIIDHYEAHSWDHILVDMERIPDTKGTVARIIQEGYPYLYTADSLEELCEKTGILKENLERTLAEYNALCEAGYDSRFFKNRHYLRKITGPKYYAARMQLNGMMGLGGLTVNHRCEVLDTNRSVIPGLYAVGMDANSINGENYSYATCGSTSSFAFISGLMVADTLRNQIKKG